MAFLVSFILTFAAALLAVAVAVFAIEVMAALALPRQGDRIHRRAPPAHRRPGAGAQ